MIKIASLIFTILLSSSCSGRSSSSVNLYVDLSKKVLLSARKELHILKSEIDLSEKYDNNNKIIQFNKIEILIARIDNVIKLHNELYGIVSE